MKSLKISKISRLRLLEVVIFTTSISFAALIVEADILHQIKQRAIKEASRVERIMKPEKHDSQEAPGNQVPLEPIDTIRWATYTNSKYRFNINYPENWRAPREEEITDSDYAYNYKVSFGADSLSENEPFGFYIFVFPTEPCSNLQNPSLSETAQCATHKSITFPENISLDHNRLYEFSSKNVTFTILPLPSPPDSPKKDQSINIFEQAVESFRFDPDFQLEKKSPLAATVQPPTPAPTTSIPAKPKVKGETATRPSRGTIQCPHPGQKPRKSKTKGKHMDEDCCPDPDEWPDPACAYKASDYAIMLKGPK